MIGLEYVLNKEEFEKGKVYDQLSAQQIGVNHMQVASMSASYDGKPGDYYVVDLYLIDKKAKDAIKCAIPAPTIHEASPSAAVSAIPTTVVISQPPVLSPAALLSPTASVTN